MARFRIKELTQLEVSSGKWTAAVIGHNTTKEPEDLNADEFEVLDTCGHQHVLGSKNLNKCLSRMSISSTAFVKH